jgi:plasmid maintenance system antidote protein VapI
MKIIREFLDLTGMRQVDLARKAEIDPAVLNSLLQGRRKAGMTTIVRLHRATGISIANLVTSAAAEESPPTPDEAAANS